MALGFYYGPYFFSGIRMGNNLPHWPATKGVCSLFIIGVLISYAQEKVYPAIAIGVRFRKVPSDSPEFDVSLGTAAKSATVPKVAENPYSRIARAADYAPLKMVEVRKS